MTHMPDEKWRELFTLVPRLSVDGVLIEKNKVLLIQRATEPFKGYWTIPGGFVDLGERTTSAVEREFYEESGIKAKAVRMIRVYDNPKRDPRGHIVSLVFLMKKVSGKLRTSNETSDVAFFPLDELPKTMAGDSEQMIKDALKILRSKKLR